MTMAVVEVGPVTVRGPNLAEADMVSAGIDAIDDALVLIEDRAVDVTDVWRRILIDVVSDSAETVVVVCPTWWPSSRLQRMHDAVRTVAIDVAVLRRAELLSDRQIWMVEMAPDFVVVRSPTGDVDVVALGDTDALLAKIPTSMPALVDAPEGVGAADPLVDHLRANGIDATIAGRDWVRRAVATLRAPDEGRDDDASPSAKRGGRAIAVAAGTLVSAVVLCGGFVARHNVPEAIGDMPMTLLVEGRVGVMVPAQWGIQRITSGPGSARLQVVSRDDATVALHITQSSLAPEQSNEQLAQSLRRALSEEPEGVFTDFNPSDSRADRPVVTYREIRPDRRIVWFVQIDQSLRIAIGCQSRPGREEDVREVCDRAIRSAHAVFKKHRRGGNRNRPGGVKPSYRSCTTRKDPDDDTRWRAAHYRFRAHVDRRRHDGCSQ